MLDESGFDVGRGPRENLCRRLGVCWDFARNIDVVLVELCGYRAEMGLGFARRPA
jgi:hypothetical protein